MHSKNSNYKAKNITNRKIVFLLVLSAVLIILAFAVFKMLDIKSNGNNNLDIAQKDVSVTLEKEEKQILIDRLENIDYLIDYNSGDIYLSDLEIGDRIADTSWIWTYYIDDDPANSISSHITWIVVAKDHFDGIEPHITLLSEDLIGFYIFDNSTNRGSMLGNNHWGNSGLPNADRGLRTWLNSTGISEDYGFFSAFSDRFQKSIIATTLHNREWEHGQEYFTVDKVFIPSTTELGDTSHIWTYDIGQPFAYFENAEIKDLFAEFDGEPRWYWTRSPNKFDSYNVRRTSSRDYKINYASESGIAVRPVVNLKSDTKVTKR